MFLLGFSAAFCFNSFATARERSYRSGGRAHPALPLSKIFARRMEKAETIEKPRGSPKSPRGSRPGPARAALPAGSPARPPLRTRPRRDGGMGDAGMESGALRAWGEGWRGAGTRALRRRRLCSLNRFPKRIYGWSPTSAPGGPLAAGGGAWGGGRRRWAGRGGGRGTLGRGAGPGPPRRCVPEPMNCSESARRGCAAAAGSGHDAEERAVQRGARPVPGAAGPQGGHQARLPQQEDGGDQPLAREVVRPLPKRALLLRGRAERPPRRHVHAGGLQLRASARAQGMRRGQRQGCRAGQAGTAPGPEGGGEGQPGSGRPLAPPAVPPPARPRQELLWLQGRGQEWRGWRFVCPHWWLFAAPWLLSFPLSDSTPNFSEVPRE